MSKTRWFCVFGMAFIVLISGIALNAQGDPAAIQLKLNAQFKLTRTTADRSDIVIAGDVVTIQKPGLVMYSADAPLPPSNTYKNGRIGQGWSGFGKDLMIGVAAPGGATAADYPHRQFVAGEKCWVTEVTAQNDGVLFKLYSDPYDDIRYYANLKIPYPNKKVVPPVEVALRLVAEVLTNDNQGGEPAPAPEAAPEPAPAPAPAPMSDIAPPPPPADTPAPTIALRQTKDQVIAGFGQPTKIIKLGVKEIYYYKDMKVTFINGKVSNVE
jgi:hypothetical protein